MREPFSSFTASCVCLASVKASSIPPGLDILPSAPNQWFTDTIQTQTGHTKRNIGTRPYGKGLGVTVSAAYCVFDVRSHVTRRKPWSFCSSMLASNTRLTGLEPPFLPLPLSMTRALSLQNEDTGLLWQLATACEAHSSGGEKIRRGVWNLPRLFTVTTQDLSMSAKLIQERESQRIIRQYGETVQMSVLAGKLGRQECDYEYELNLRRDRWNWCGIYV